MPDNLDDSFINIYNPSTAPANVVHINIQTDTGSHVLDAWGRPIILQIPYDTGSTSYQLDYARLVSAGSGTGLGAGNGSIDTTIHNNLDASDRGGVTGYCI